MYVSQSVRPIAAPNESFIEQLREYEQELIKQRALALSSSTSSTHNIAHTVDIGPSFPGPSLSITDSDTIPEAATSTATTVPSNTEVSVASEVDSVDDNLTASVSKTVEVIYDKQLDTTGTTVQVTKVDGLSEERDIKRLRV